MSFIFYDTETTGTNKNFDQIIQFAAIRTDADMNEVDQFEIRSRILPYVVPSPGAMRVTRVTASQLVSELLPTHYEMVSSIREKLIEWSPATFMGYNSIEFDEHLLRQAFYKNLFPLYLTNTNGNCRSDVMRAIQTAVLFVPNAIRIYVGNNNKHVFKLDEVAPANGYAHESAHDALDDVRATIHLARLVADSAPDIWSTFMRFSNKAAVNDYLSEERVVVLSDFYFGKPYSWCVTLIGKNALNSSEQYVFNLSIDPDELNGLSQTDLKNRMAAQPKPVRSVRSNAAPILMSCDEVPRFASICSLDVEELENRADRLREDSDLCDRLVTGFEATRMERKPSPHVEQQIYDDFISPIDEHLMEAFHKASWEDRLAIVSRFEAPRLQELGMRLIHSERPYILEERVRSQFDTAVAERLTDSSEAALWLTLPQAIQQVNDLIVVAEGEESEFLQEHRDYLSKRLRESRAYLA